METCPVTYFKNHALKILSSLAESGTELILTKHGKPLAHMEPVKTVEKPVLGKLKGTMQINDDIVAPMGSDDWDACK